MRYIFWFMLMIIVVIGSGCSTTIKSAPVEERVASDASETRVVPAQEESPFVLEEQANTNGGVPRQGMVKQQPSANPAVVALLSEAENNIRSGNEDNAAASIERALRLEPKDAYLWHRLAGIRLRQNNWQQAYVLASKSNSLASGNKPLQIANWKIILYAKNKQDDKTGLALAKKELKRLQKSGQ